MAIATALPPTTSMQDKLEADAKQYTRKVTTSVKEYTFTHPKTGEELIVEALSFHLALQEFRRLVA